MRNKHKLKIGIVTPIVMTSMRNLLPVLILLLSISFILFPQTPAQAKDQPPSKQEPNKNIIEQYIPKDLPDALTTLKRELSKESMVEIAAYKTASEFVGNAHFGLGMTLRNSWGLRSDSRLAKWFNKHEIFHPDDMTGIILDALWCDLTGNTFSFEKKLLAYKAYWEGQKGPDNPVCPTCGARVEFIEIKDLEISPTDYITYQHGACTKTKDHQWIWDKKNGWRNFTEEEWSKL